MASNTSAVTLTFGIIVALSIGVRSHLNVYLNLHEVMRLIGKRIRILHLCTETESI